MDEQQQDGTHSGTPLVHIMHTQLAKPVHGERVQLTLVRAPVIHVIPSASEPPDVGEWRAVGPVAGAGADPGLIWRAGVVEPALD